MSEKTCAACDEPLVAPSIRITIGGVPVEVCCEACALALGEADRAARGPIQVEAR